MHGVFAEFSLRKKAWRNPKEGRLGCFHQDIVTRKVTDIAFTSDFCNNYSHSASPASCIWRPRVPVPHFPASHTWCPQVPSLASPSPKSQVPTHASRCPRPLNLVPVHFYTQPENTVGWSCMPHSPRKATALLRNIRNVRRKHRSFL